MHLLVTLPAKKLIYQWETKWLQRTEIMKDELGSGKAVQILLTPSPHLHLEYMI